MSNDLKQARSGFGGIFTKRFNQYGHEFTVKTKEGRWGGNYKKRIVFMYETSYDVTSDMLVKTVEREKRDGFFGDIQPIMDRTDQVATTTNEGLKNFLQIKAHKESASDDVWAAIEATAEVWEEEFQTTEEFPQ